MSYDDADIGILLLERARELIKKGMEKKRKEIKTVKAEKSDKWLNKRQAAAYLGCSVRTIYRLENRNKLTFQEGKILKSKLDIYIKNNKSYENV